MLLSKLKEKLSKKEISPQEENFNQWTLKRDNNAYKNIYNLINRFMKENQTPLFTNIEIETVNRCNGTCSFCPVNKNDDKREYKKMSKELFKNIIFQLKELNYNGSIAFHSNNEPLLDKRIIDFVKYTRKELPDAYLYLFTNGTLLTLDKFKQLIENLDLIVIDNYNDKKEMHNSVKEVYNYCCENSELKKKVLIELRLQNQVLTSRGGESNNRNNIKSLKSSCLLPYSKIVVQPDGTVPLCCCDPFANVILGDLNKKSLIEIWNDNNYNLVREKLFKEKYARENLKKCEDCDALVEKIDGIPYTVEEVLSYWDLL